MSDGGIHRHEQHMKNNVCRSKAADDITDEQQQSVLAILVAAARREQDDGDTDLDHEIHSLGDTVIWQVKNIIIGA